MAHLDRIHCRNCDKRCYGEALRVQDFHFHPACFVCKVCNMQLADQGFYMHEEYFFCSKDYLEKFGTRCHTCGDFVEGDVISALDNTYHQHCFVCAHCREPFPPGEQVTQEGDACFCEKCLSTRDAESAARLCPMCKEFVELGQGLLALEKVWHVWCFRCKECGVDLSAKYIVKDDQAYCEDDFNKLHGIRCELCAEFIAGKVVQAGDSFFHASCSQCAVCGKQVYEEADVFVLGSSIWHSECFSSSASEKVDNEDQMALGNSDVPHIIAYPTESEETKDSLVSKSDNRNEQASALSPASSANESPEKRPDSQVSTGDSAISCTSPTGVVSEAETVAMEADQLVGAIGGVQESDLENRLSVASENLPSPELAFSRPASEASTTRTISEQESCPTTPTPTPGVVQRTPSTSSSGSGGRIRPKSFAGVPRRSGSLSSSSSSFNWKEMYTVDDKEEQHQHAPLPKSTIGIKSLAHGVVSPSTNADRFLRRENKSTPSPSSLRDTSVSPTSPTSSTTPLSLIEESESSPSTVPREQAKPQNVSPIPIDKRTFSLADLQLSDNDILLPKGVDRTRLEEYLTDDGFEEALGMARDTFYKLQVWKQRELKRKAKLF